MDGELAYMTAYQENTAVIEVGEEVSGQAQIIDTDFSHKASEARSAVGFQNVIAKKPLSYRFIKRAFDIVFSLAVIVVTFIPMLVLSIAIAIDTKAFPIYSQERVGQHGPFRFYKLRSMVKDSDDFERYFTPEQLAQWQKEHKVDSDPRVASRIIDTTARRSCFDPAVASVFPPKMTEISAAFSQVKLAFNNLRNLLKNSFQNLLSHTSATTNFFAESKFAHVSALSWMNNKTGCEVLNLGTGEGYSVLEMVKAFEDVVGHDIPYVIKPRRAGDVAECCSNPIKALEVLGWKAERNLSDMYADSWRWQSNTANGYGTE